MARDECIHCHRPRSAHGDGVLEKCPRGHGYYHTRYNAQGQFDCDRQRVPVCPHCGQYKGREVIEPSNT